MYGIAVFSMVAMAGAQISESQPSQDFINKRITEIVDSALQRGTGATPEGVRTTPMRAEASLKEMDEIKLYGTRAIAPLNAYLEGSNYRAQHLAVRLLSYIGGNEVTAPLSRAAEHSPSQIVRLTAVECLGQQNWEYVAATVKRIAASDSNQLVREHAQRVVLAHEREQHQSTR
jgi:hypothetical protein